MVRQNYPRVLSASTLIGDRIVNTAGEKLGSLEEIMLDLSSGRVACAVLSFGGILGIGDKLFAIPWSALTVDTENKQLILDVPKETLQKAPGFDKTNWPDMASEEFETQIHSYYGRQPYWQEVDVQSRRQMERGSSMGEQERLDADIDRGDVDRL